MSTLNTYFVHVKKLVVVEILLHNYQPNLSMKNVRIMLPAAPQDQYAQPAFFPLHILLYLLKACFFYLSMNCIFYLLYYPLPECFNTDAPYISI